MKDRSRVHGKFSEEYSIDEKTIRKFYIEKQFGSVKIANMFGCSKGTILRILRKYNISRRRCGPPNGYFIDKNDLKNKYINDCLSTNEIAKIYGCSGRVIVKRLKKYGISVRTKKEAARIVNIRGNIKHHVLYKGHKLRDDFKFQVPIKNHKIHRKIHGLREWVYQKKLIELGIPIEWFLSIDKELIDAVSRPIL